MNKTFIGLYGANASGKNIVSRLFSNDDLVNTDHLYIRLKEYDKTMPLMSIKLAKQRTNIKNIAIYNTESYNKFNIFNTEHIVNYCILNNIKFSHIFYKISGVNSEPLTKFLENGDKFNILVNRDNRVAILSNILDFLGNGEGIIYDIIYDCISALKMFTLNKAPKIHYYVTYSELMMNPSKVKRDICKICNIKNVSNINKRINYNSYINKHEFKKLSSIDVNFLNYLYDAITIMFIKYNIIFNKHITLQDIMCEK